MKKLTRYIFGQLFFTILAVTLILTCIMWLAQSLRYIDFIANKGVPLLLFLEMIVYLLPNLVVIVIPIAVLIGVIFIYNKLISDHELIVMQGSGISHWQLAKPAGLVSLFFTLVLYVFTLYFLPISFRNYRDISTALKEKNLTSLLQVGNFNTLGNYTVYARSRDLQGNFLGLLIYDGRETNNPKIFMAEKGVVFGEEKGGRLLLLKGNRQEKEARTGKPSILYFDQYIIEANQPSSGGGGGRFMKAYERHVGELMNPSKDLPPSLQLEFLAAAHQRFLSPLYALTFGMLAVCFMILGSFNRKGRSGKILSACVLASLVEVVAMILLNTLKHLTITIPLAYSLVVITIIVCLGALMPFARRLSCLGWFRRSA